MDVKVGFAFIKITAYPYKIKCGTALKEYNTHVQLCNQSIHSTTQNEKPLYIYRYIYIYIYIVCQRFWERFRCCCAFANSSRNVRCVCSKLARRLKRPVTTFCLTGQMGLLCSRRSHDTCFEWDVSIVV